jgi:hypothetical protein
MKHQVDAGLTDTEYQADTGQTGIEQTGAENFVGPVNYEPAANQQQIGTEISADTTASDQGTDPYYAGIEADSSGASVQQGVVDDPVADANNMASTSSTSTPPRSRPTTCLQQGIHKPKMYSNRTIRYNGKFGLLNHSGEPQNL